eukprot:CAMPEP_0185266030 /NCGR_PEP_ID=MMETSP1359-20130426/29683_1 /TAXON_ID=552665 /ORGANISM="Bigelowiella longifila, Strain CCMP242" /LENGTH=180 /DNA_ID=CAMNT_0027855633 /DNA_START=130 /DNA_END=669 /DNA_ORIENTATION=-
MSDNVSVDKPDVTFLDNFRDIFTFLITWTVTTVALAFTLAGTRIAIVQGCKCTPSSPILLIPLLMCILGIGVGLWQGALTACMIAALYRSIPYSPGVDITTGLGIGQAIVILYIQLGGAVFIHYFSCNPDETEEDLHEDYPPIKKESMNSKIQDVAVDSWNTGLRMHRPKFYHTDRIQLF